MAYAIDRGLEKQEIRRLLQDRQEGNVVQLFRNMATSGNPPKELAWLKKEPNSSRDVLKDTFAIYGGSYNGGSVDIDAATEFVNDIGSSSYRYTGPQTTLQD